VIRVIELAILGLLKEQDLHGYELKKQLTELLGPWSSVSFGSLYPALSRLERDGWVEAVAADRQDRLSMPMTGALSGEVAAFRGRRSATRGRRNKKVYAITPAGSDHLVALLTDDTHRDRKGSDERLFALRVAFCRHLPPTDRLTLFERRHQAVTSRLADRRDPGEGKLDAYLRSLRDHDDRTLTHDLEWLEQLIADERAAIDEAGGAADAPARAS
jgi:DNA-binding PadR family transcriptional regulator